MSTRSRIGILKENGTVESVYCHSDGYPKYNGALLLNYYNSEEKAQAIIDLGDISFLEKTLEFGETRDYNRWRNEGTKKRIDSSLDEYLDKYGRCCEDYQYLFKDNKWYIFDDGKYTELTPLETIEECKEFKY